MTPSFGVMPGFPLMIRQGFRLSFRCPPKQSKFGFSKKRLYIQAIFRKCSKFIFEFRFTFLKFIGACDFINLFLDAINGSVFQT